MYNDLILQFHKIQNNETKFNMDSKNLEEKRTKSLGSKIKATIAQCCAVSVPDLLMLSFGMSIGFSTVIIPELYKKDAEIVVTREELTWISSMNFFIVPLGALTAGPLVDRVGRRPMMFLSAVPFLLGWFLFHWWATNAWTLMLGLALLGFASGVIDPSGQIYTSEIGDVRYRGTMLTSLTLALTLGIFLQVLIGNYLHWRTFALVNAIFPAVALVGIFLVPESPQWLANRGRLSDAERSLRWLRGWTNSDSVKREYNLLVETSSIRTVEQTSSCCGSFAQRYFRRIVVLPFLMLGFSFFVSCFNGTISLQTYSVLVFEMIESPMDEYNATIILSSLQVLAPMILILVIKRTGKRVPTLLSLIISCLALLGVGVYVYLRQLNVIQKGSDHSWVPTTLVLLAVFASSGGIKCSPWFIASELFPVEVRGVTMGILASSCNIFAALANKSFLYMLDEFTLPGTFVFFAAVNFLGLAVLYWAMPETEGKTLAEIEKFFRRKSKTHEDEERVANINRAMEPL